MCYIYFNVFYNTWTLLPYRRNTYHLKKCVYLLFTPENKLHRAQPLFNFCVLLPSNDCSFKVGSPCHRMNIREQTRNIRQQLRQTLIQMTLTYPANGLTLRCTGFLSMRPEDTFCDVSVPSYKYCVILYNKNIYICILGSISVSS